MLEDPHVRARNMLVKTEDPTIGNMEMHGNPVKFDCYPDPVTRPRAPPLDGDRERILREFGISERDLENHQSKL